MPQKFHFDHVLWSVDGSRAATQEHVYFTLGEPLLQNLLRGYNACLLCYGQTGSGKTHSMTGTPDDPGVLPPPLPLCIWTQTRARHRHVGNFRL